MAMIDSTRLTRSRFLRHTCLGFSALLLVTACGGGGTDTAGDSASSGDIPVLTVATEPAFPPFESQAGDGSLEGFDIDLMTAIGEQAGYEVEFESLPFDGIIPALQAGTVDAAISGMTITAEREENVDFTDPYFQAGLAIATRQDDSEVQSFEDLENKRIAVQIGTTGAEKANEVAGAEVSTFDSAPLALQELRNGNVDAVINDAPVTLYAIKEGNLNDLEVVGEQLTSEYYGIALPTGSENLEAINQALDEIIADGTYAEIYQKWFGTEPPELPENYTP